MNTDEADAPSREAFRIRLRPMRDEDEALYCALYSDPDTMAFIGSALSAKSAIRSFRKALVQIEGGSRFCAIVERATGTAIGLGGWQPPDPDHRRVEVGAMLVANARKQRYSIEAVAAIIDAAFASLPIDTVWVQYRVANVAAGRLCDTLGMEPLVCKTEESVSSTSVVRSVHRSTWRHAWFIDALKDNEA